MGVLEDLLGKKPETRTVEVPLEPELAQRWDKAKQALTDAERALAAARQEAGRATTSAGMTLLREDIDARQAELEEAKGALADVEEELEPHMARFVFKAITAEEFEALKNEHKPTADQRKEASKAGEKMEWNPHTFQPALIAAACERVETASGKKEGLTEDEARQLWESPEWNVGLKNEMFNACLAAHYFYTRVDLGKG